MPKLSRNTIVMIVIAAIVVIIFLMQPKSNGGGSGLPMAQVVVPTLSEQARAGEVLYTANCAKCHGENSAGKDGFAPPLVHRLYEPNHHTDGTFRRAAKLGVRAHHWRFGNMPPVNGITRPDVNKVILYVRELQRANDIN